MDALSLVLEGVRRGQIKLDDLARPLAAFADALESINAGQVPRFSWRTLIMGRAPDPRELRRFILVQPVLDFGALEPGARAVAAIREAVQAFPDGVAYATKAFLCKAMARLAYDEGMLLDVASGGEMHVALAAGVPVIANDDGGTGETGNIALSVCTTTSEMSMCGL